jgi:hypothetical protein
VFLGAKLEYIEDPFGRQKEIDRKELEAHHAKLQEKPFANKVKQTDAFNSISKTYGEDRDYP